MLHEHILQIRPQLDQQITFLQQKLSSYPTENLICGHDKNKCKWYQTDGHTKKLIPKANRSLAEQLALKKYDSYTLNELLQEKKAQDSYLRLYPSTKKSEHLLSLPGYADLLSSHFQPLSQELNTFSCL